MKRPDDFRGFPFEVIEKENARGQMLYCVRALVPSYHQVARLFFFLGEKWCKGDDENVFGTLDKDGFAVETPYLHWIDDEALAKSIAKALRTASATYHELMDYD